MSSRIRRGIVRLALSLLDKEMAISSRLEWSIFSYFVTSGCNIIWLVQSHVPWFYQRSFNVEAIDFVEHGFDEALYGVLCSTVGPKTRDTECTGYGREDEVATGVLSAEVREGKLDDVKGAEEVRVELVAEVVVVLVFTCANHA